MVSTASYSVSEVILMILFSYILLFINFMEALIIALLSNRKWWITVASYLGMGALLMAAYSLNFKIGFVMFVNGGLTVQTVLTAVHLVQRWGLVMRSETKLQG